MCSVSRRAGFGGNTGTATTPALRQARNAIVKSIDGGYTNSALLYMLCVVVACVYDVSVTEGEVR